MPKKWLSLAKSNELRKENTHQVTEDRRSDLKFNEFMLGIFTNL